MPVHCTELPIKVIVVQIPGIIARIKSAMVSLCSGVEVNTFAFSRSSNPGFPFLYYPVVGNPPLVQYINV